MMMGGLVTILSMHIEVRVCRKRRMKSKDIPPPPGYFLSCSGRNFTKRDHHDVATTILIENCLFSEIRNIGLLWAKVRRFCLKSTDVLCKEVRCFGIPVLLRVEDVSTFFLSPPQKKKFFENLLHFLHPVWKTLINSGIFGCRFGCRIKCRV